MLLRRELNCADHQANVIGSFHIYTLTLAISHETLNATSPPGRTGIEKSSPRRNHVLAVAWITRSLVLDDQKIAIALPRQVEAMARRAPTLRPVRFDQQPIDRTSEIRGRDDMHWNVSTASNSSSPSSGGRNQN
jgi:hypothetical protein